MEREYKVEYLPMSEIFHDSDFNCRGKIAPIDVLDLAKDIEARGLDQPIVVRPYEDPKQPQYKYKIVAGHRRHMAFKVNKSPTIPAYVRSDFNELSAHMFNLRENLHRQQLNVKQEAHALKFFINYKREGTDRPLFTESELGEIFGQSRGWVQNRKALLSLPDDIQDEAAAGILNQDHIKQLARIKDKNQQYELVRRIKEKKLRGEKVNLTQSIKRPNDVLRASERDKSEIDELNGLLYDITGPCLATRCLAWAAGNISTSELFATVQEHCKENDIPFTMPQFVNDAITGVRGNDKVVLS